jgi:hypothetical protein
LGNCPFTNKEKRELPTKKREKEKRKGEKRENSLLAMLWRMLY